ncbi:MAG TPA: serine/threonine-protein kinase [Polyangiaceae bacterium]|nr:serine/threonine-protein kinase [Polyangiaceae bacterium]
MQSGKDDSIEISVNELDRDQVEDPSTLVSSQPASSRRSRDPSSSARSPVSVDGMGDTLRDPVDARPTLPAETDAEPARNAVSTMSRTMDAGDPSYDSGVLFEPTPAPSTVDEPVADPLIGMVIADRYRIVDQLGRGGMGIVYRVDHVSLSKLLAMKLLTGELSANKEVVRRFKQEAMTVSKLSSPHTVQVFDFGQWNHLTYLVMELVDGYDLSRPLRHEGPMPYARLGKLVVQVCASLAEAHGKGIVHRDMKPENIMIIHGPRGGEIAKVLDFGLAKLRENTELNEVTLQGAVIGTPYYMSPEQVLGEEVDGRTDIYSLGAVMFRALTGTQAFQAATPMGMFTKHLTEPAPTACERAPKLAIPKGVSDAIARCMQKDPKERFQTVEELREVLMAELTALGLPSSERLLLGDEATSDPAGTPPKKPLFSITGKHSKSLAAQPHKFSGTGKFSRTGKIVRAELAQSQILTREELLAYERKLRRTRYGTWGLLGLVLLGGVGAAAHFALKARSGSLAGLEREPNDNANDANTLVLGSPVQGYIGRRLEPTKGDRDFYWFELEGASQVSLRLDALPNFATCALLYRIDMPRPLGQYCTGRPQADLVLPALRLEGARYLVAVMQDPNGAPFVLENISDPYELEIGLVSEHQNEEVEPNDDVASALRLSSGDALEGTLGFLGDEDVVCTQDDADGSARWVVEDGARPKGTVLEATPLTEGQPGPLVRVHAADHKPYGRPRLEADLNSPWSSPVFTMGETPRCLRLRLTSDPWSEVPAGHQPEGDATRYRVTLANAKP